MIIYTITNVETGKQYVGKTVESLDLRIRKHKAKAKTSTYPLYSAFKKYGIAAFSVEQIDTASTEEELNSKERSWISKLGTTVPTGYNLTLGGEGGNTLRFLSEEQKRARAEKISKALTGRVRTPEHALAISRANKGVIGKRGKAMLGRTLSKETRQKMSATHKGKSTWNTGTCRSPEEEKTVRKEARLRKKSTQP